MSTPPVGVRGNPSAGPARPHQPALVGEHQQLRRVAAAELADGPADAGDAQPLLRGDDRGVIQKLRRVRRRTGSIMLGTRLVSNSACCGFLPRDVSGCGRCA
ncbi:hypothetical protein ACFPM0_18950 [Pseudonocardia sulfidoxydans]|uniref:hypothetical protein n=1 Tax=Pseudonocardia sulfidoxydans TaxID=54011 RepID=UPI00361D8A85